MFNQQLGLFGETSVSKLLIQIKAVLVGLAIMSCQLAFAATLPGDPGLQACGTSSNTGGKFALCAARQAAAWPRGAEQRAAPRGAPAPAATASVRAPGPRGGR